MARFAAVVTLLWCWSNALESGGDGVRIRITAPGANAVVGSPVVVRLHLEVGSGPVAERVRAAPDAWRACYAALGRGFCGSLGASWDGAGAALDLPSWPTPHVVVAWIEDAAGFAVATDARNVTVASDDAAASNETCGEERVRIAYPRNGAIVDGDAVEVAVEAVGGPLGADEVYCVALCASRHCATELPARVSLPCDGRGPRRLTAWVERGGRLSGAPTYVPFRRAAPVYSLERYAPPYPAGRLILERDFIVTVPEHCEPMEAACVLTRNASCGTGCHYFQHAAVYLLPCWSFFRRFSDLPPVVVARDGLFLGHHPWTAFLLKAMGAVVVQQTLPRCAVVGARRAAPSASGDEEGGAPRFLGLDPLPWLAKADDAEALQRNLGLAKADRGLTIGVIPRRLGSGHFEDIDALLRSLEAAFPAATINVTSFDDIEPQDQAAFAHASDVLISPHGAQLANVAFARRCSVVLELFPRHYFIPGYFSALALSVGALAYVGYDGANSTADLGLIRAASSDVAQRHRRSPVAVDAAALVRTLVDDALPRRAACVADRHFSSRRLAAPWAPPAVAPTISLVRAAAATDGSITLHLDVTGVDGTDGALSLCAAALGDRWCSPLAGKRHAARIAPPRWTARVRVGAWLEDAAFRRFGAHNLDLDLRPPANTTTKLRIVAPRVGAVLDGPFLPQLEIDATAAAIDGRQVRTCYAVLDQRCCVLLWTKPGAIGPSEDLSVASENMRPVFDVVRAPPGRHELVAWLETGADTLVAYASTEFTQTTYAGLPPGLPGGET